MSPKGFNLGSSTNRAIFFGGGHSSKFYNGNYEIGSASPDWDTYENGIFFSANFIDRDGAVSTPLAKTWQGIRQDGPLKDSTSSTYTYFNLSSSVYRQGLRTLNTGTTGRLATWGDDSDRPVVSSAGSGTQTFTNNEIPPYIAVYDATLEQWMGVAAGNSSGSNRLFYGSIWDGSNAPTHGSVNHKVITVALTTDPGDISGWRDYDGPDDWDVWENGIITVPSVGGTASGDLLVNANDPNTTLLPTVGGYNASNWPAIRYGGTNQDNYDEAWEWIAVWNQTDKQWLGYSQRSGSGYSYDRVDFRDNASSSGYLLNTTGKHCIFVGLKRQPTNFANWRDYDGPLYSGWDDPNFNMLGLASGGANYVSTASIYFDYTEGLLAESGTGARISRSNTYGLRTYGFVDNSNSTQYTAGVRYRVYWDTVFGWMRIGPSNASWDFPDIDTYPYSINYNSFYSNAPAALMVTDTDPGDLSNWPAYDGPVANWDTYANGVFIATDVGSTVSSTVFEQIPSYASTTYTRPTTSLWTINNSPVTNGYYFEDSQYDPNQNVPDSQKPPYIAVYVHEYSADGDFGDMPPGWYVFENYDQTFRPRGRTTWEKPVAWPTPSGNYNFYSNVIDTGYMANVIEDGSGVIYVFLDEYNDPVGSGGTDHWTKPPFVISAPISSINLSTQRISLDFSGLSTSYAATYNGITDFGSYHYEPLRGLQWLAKDMSGYGTVDIEVYHDSLLVGTGTWNATVGDGGVDFISFSNLVGYPSQADFYNSVAVNDRMWFIVYHND